MSSSVPIISRITHDPGRVMKTVNEADKDINRRYKAFGKALSEELEAMLTPYAQKMTGNVSLVLFDEFAVNDTQWQYTGFNGSSLTQVAELVQRLIDEYILGINSFEYNFDQFIGYYVDKEFERGLRASYANLAAQSDLYEETQTLAAILNSDRYQSALNIALFQSYEDWKGLTGQLKGKIVNLVAEGVAAGVSPSLLAKEIEKQGVKPGTARNMARTELIGAYRKARLDEGERARNELGINLQYLWLSALSPTTRLTHARKHGNIYTAEEIADFYSKNGNRYNCRCNQTEILVDNEGKPRSKKLIERLDTQKEKWIDKLDNPS